MEKSQSKLNIAIDRNIIEKTNSDQFNKTGLSFKPKSMINAIDEEKEIKRPRNDIKGKIKFIMINKTYRHKEF